MLSEVLPLPMFEMASPFRYEEKAVAEKMSHTFSEK